jgi:hypothetical protein
MKGTSSRAAALGVSRMRALRSLSSSALSALLLAIAACDGAEGGPAEAEVAAADMDAGTSASTDDAFVSPEEDAAGDEEDASADDAGSEDAGSALPEHCATASTPPATLECTGLYTDLESKRLLPGLRAYAPAFSLWSDGSSKQRWISLPDGQTIDSSDPNEWRFPVGTKLFKEFSRNGKRVETRMWHKAGNNFWVNAVYAWNEDETEAARSAGGDVTLSDGSDYHIPSQDECEKCHRGRTERILGFDQVLLGLRGVQGVSLRDLADENLLSQTPESSELAIGDDGSGLAPSVLGWLHANCGITCHNGNSRAVGYPTGLRLRLDPADLDGRPVREFDAYETTIGMPVTTVNWSGQTRIVPGHPEQSLLYRLITTRGQGKQMPPFASSQVDAVDSVLVGEWIRRMPPLDAGQDGGAPGVDAGPSAEDAGSPRRDAGPPGHDAGPPAHDAGPPPHDAGLPDHDAAPPGHDAGPAGEDGGPTEAADATPVDSQVLEP